jgi:hypothetical protein
MSFFNRAQCIRLSIRKAQSCIELEYSTMIKERLPALVRDLFTFSSKVIKSFIIV